MTGAEFRPACNAPFTSMHLDPRGLVRACCMNDYQSLGTIGSASLRAIWAGAQAQRLREHLAVGDFSLGCEKCAWAIDAGVPESAYLNVFADVAPSGPEPTWPRRLELALSNTCNLRCVMCNGDLSSSIRSQREHRPPLPTVYDDEFFDELRPFLAHVEHITFLGGEPFLGREPLRVFDMLIEDGRSPICHVTTNGTQWNDRVRSYIEAFPIHIAVSVDALSVGLAESIRLGVDHSLVLRNIDEIRRATAAPGKGCSLAFCLMRQNWHEFADLLVWADDRELDVFVNRVTSPPSFSLALAPIVELTAVLAALEARDAELSALPRNAGVWSQELAQMRALVGQRSVPTGAVDELLASFPSHWPAATITADDGQIVVSADTDVASDRIDFGQLVGHSLQDLVEHLQHHLGPTTGTRLRLHPGGIEERRLRFAGAEHRTEVRAILTVLPGGFQRWTIRLDERSLDDSVEWQDA